jgi:hypothetical protein
MTDKLTIGVFRDGVTRRLQVSISQLAEDGTGHGYRLAGPKFNGTGEKLLERPLDERDAAEIRRYLDAVFPHPAAAYTLAVPLSGSDDAITDSVVLSSALEEYGSVKRDAAQFDDSQARFADSADRLLAEVEAATKGRAGR